MSLTPPPHGDVVNSIMVAVRKRPKIAFKESGENDLVRCEASTKVIVYEPKTKLDLTPVIEPSVFSFDHVFDEAATNKDVYETCCRPLLRDVKSGGGAVVFAFGQTGSGKTYTMLGRSDECQGLYSFTVRELLEMGTLCTLAISFYEVYGAKLYDLLNGRAEVKMLQDEASNIHIVGLSERIISAEEGLRQVMSEGQLLRASGMTRANDRSSRSHAVLEIKVRLHKHEGAPRGRVTFVDLAGSERAADTADAGTNVRREGAEINKSLLALKECIRAVSMRRRHIPFRTSKLTQILRESFVGRCKTCVIANISPCQRHCEDTLNTLRYAHRIKELKNPTSDDLERETPMPCQNCGLPVFAGDKHVCLRVNVQCPHCRQEMDKQDLVVHFTECREFPIRCPHCNEHLLRAELVRHNRRCSRFPVRCSLCSCRVLRSNMERHTLTECSAAKEKCRHCGAQFPRPTLESHERECEMVRVACCFCLRHFRKSRLEAHVAECAKNPNRRVVPSPRRCDSNLSVAPSQERECRTPQEQRRLGRREILRGLGPSRQSSIVCSSSDEASAPALLSGRQGDVELLCPYARYGCTQKVSRTGLAEHLAKAVAQHLRLVSAYADQMEVENAALRRLVVANNTKSTEVQ